MRSQAVSTRDKRSAAWGMAVSLRVLFVGIIVIHQEMNTMSDLKARFEQAVADSKQLPERPDNMTMLKIYALYKQATSGDVQGARPGFGDMVGRAKFDAWNELKGKSTDEAMQSYIDLIESLK
jgi:acyl-CoA-binding protein